MALLIRGGNLSYLRYQRTSAQLCCISSLKGKLLCTLCAQCVTAHTSPFFELGSTTPSYPEFCSNRPVPGKPPCGESMLKEIIVGAMQAFRPRKSFVLHDFRDYLGAILSNPKHEETIEKSCEQALEAIKNGPNGTQIHNVFEGDFVKEFVGPDGQRLFIEGEGGAANAVQFQLRFLCC